MYLITPSLRTLHDINIFLGRCMGECDGNAVTLTSLNEGEMYSMSCLIFSSSKSLHTFGLL